MSGERILCPHRKPQCILSFIGLTRRDSMKNQPWKTSPCWVFQEARSARSWGEHREGGLCVCGRQERRCLKASSCYCWGNPSKLAVVLQQIYIIARVLLFFFPSASSLRFAYMVATVLLSVLVRKLFLHPVKGQVMETKYELVTSPKEEAWITVSKRS